MQVVRPKILGFISEQASAWLVALVVLVVGSALTVVVAWAASDLYQQQVRQRFQLLVNERYSRIQERFEDQEQRLGSLQRFFVNSGEVSRNEFDGFAKPLLLHARAYAWAPRIFRTQRSLFEQDISRQRGIPFSIRELNTSGELAPAAERDEYVPVLYSQTQSLLGSPLGFDLLAQPAPCSAGACTTKRPVGGVTAHAIGGGGARLCGRRVIGGAREQSRGGRALWFCDGGDQHAPAGGRGVAQAQP